MNSDQLIWRGYSASLFDAYYFTHGCGEPYEHSKPWLDLFRVFCDGIAQSIQPKTVLDAGCAIGLLVEGLRERGIEAWGVDISEYAIGKVSETIREYCWVGSVTEPFPRRYDLIVSIEVLEHMLQSEAEKAVENFCQFSDDVLFSSSPIDYKEVTHLNVQPPGYWAELFARHGFFRDIDFDASFITPWAVRYRRNSDPLPRLVRDYERKYWQLLKENVDLRQLTLEMREQLASQDPKNQNLADKFRSLVSRQK
jgi:SAM-dependent methyltransferase